MFFWCVVHMGPSGKVRGPSLISPQRSGIVMDSANRPLSSSFLVLLYRILNTNHNKELLRGLWVNPKPQTIKECERTLMQPCFG